MPYLYIFKDDLCIFPDMEFLTLTQKSIELPINPPEQFQGKEEHLCP